MAMIVVFTMIKLLSKSIHCKNRLIKNRYDWRDEVQSQAKESCEKRKSRQSEAYIAINEEEWEEIEVESSGKL